MENACFCCTKLYSAALYFTSPWKSALALELGHCFTSGHYDVILIY